MDLTGGLGLFFLSLKNFIIFYKNIKIFIALVQCNSLVKNLQAHPPYLQNGNSKRVMFVCLHTESSSDLRAFPPL